MISADALNSNHLSLTLRCSLENFLPDYIHSRSFAFCRLPLSNVLTYRLSQTLNAITMKPNNIIVLCLGILIISFGCVYFIAIEWAKARAIRKWEARIAREEAAAAAATAAATAAEAPATAA